MIYNVVQWAMEAKTSVNKNYLHCRYNEQDTWENDLWPDQCKFFQDLCEDEDIHDNITHTQKKEEKKKQNIHSISYIYKFAQQNMITKISL